MEKKDDEKAKKETIEQPVSVGFLSDINFSNINLGKLLLLVVSISGLLVVVFHIFYFFQYLTYDDYERAFADKPAPLLPTIMVNFTYIAVCYYLYKIHKELEVKVEDK